MSNSAGNPNEFEDCVAIVEWDVLPKSTYMSPRGVAPYCAETNVTLPVFSDMLYFLGRGPLTKGIIQFASGRSSDAVNIGITFFYYSPNMLDCAKVCMLQRDEVNNGVGILVRLDDSHAEQSTLINIVDFDAHRHPRHGGYSMLFYTGRIPGNR